MRPVVIYWRGEGSGGFFFGGGGGRNHLVFRGNREGGYHNLRILQSLREDQVNFRFETTKIPLSPPPPQTKRKIYDAVLRAHYQNFPPPLPSPIAPLWPRGSISKQNFTAGLLTLPVSASPLSNPPLPLRDTYLVVSALNFRLRGLSSRSGRVIVFCSWAKLFPLFAREYKWVPADRQGSRMKR